MVPPLHIVTAPLVVLVPVLFVLTAAVLPPPFVVVLRVDASTILPVPLSSIVSIAPLPCVRMAYIVVQGIVVQVAPLVVRVQ
jgi:hypothetical protein